MTIQIPTILIYDDKRSKTHIANLPQKLRNDFEPSVIKIARSCKDDFSNAIRSFRPSIVILPEILGEESFYSRHIPETTRQQLKEFVKDGGMLATFCASTYWMGEKIVYHPPKGITKFRDSNHAFNAAAMKMFGPVPGLWLPSNGKPNMGGCREIDILVKTANGIERDKVWYGNGPCILPIAKQSLPDSLKPLAYYDKIEDFPIAAAELSIGKGSILMSGPLPHYTGGNVRSNNLLWRVLSHKMHQQLFAKEYPSMISLRA